MIDPLDDAQFPDLGKAKDAPIAGNGAAEPFEPEAAKANGHDPDPQKLIPYRDALVQFAEVMFRNARKDGFVSFRMFTDSGGTNKKALRIEAVRLNDPEFADLMSIMAEQAANWHQPAVFAPPVATFKNHLNAKADNIYEGVALSVECDEAPEAAREKLEVLLGETTIAIESGGEWMDEATGEIQPKVHLHWRLKVTASTIETQALLYEARALAAKLVGADTSNVPVAHPIRWPGSWHRKSSPRLAKIVSLAENTEIDLEQALEALREAAEAAGLATVTPRSPGEQGMRNGYPREAGSPSAVVQALAMIPNGIDPKEHHWKYWIDIGLKIWASTSGSEEGRAAYHQWSSKSPKYNKANTDERWDHFAKYPPNRVGFGSLVFLARLQDPDWRYENSIDPAVEAAVDEFIGQLLRERDEPDDEANGGTAGAGAGTGSAGAAPGGNAGSAGAAPGGAQAKPLIAATPYVWIDPKKIPMRDWLYGRLLVRKFVSLTVAPGGTGKSSLITAETMSQVSGKNLLGITPPDLLRVWLWNLEDPQEETQRKIQATALHYGLEPADLGNRLFVDSGRDQKLVIATMNRDGPMIVRPVVDALVKEVLDKQIDILVIDPFVSCNELPENDNTSMDMVVKEWGKVAEWGKCAVHLVDHTRKAPAGTEVSTESTRGGKAKTDAARVVRVVNPMSETESKEAGVENRRFYFRTYNDKANLAPPADKSEWFNLKSVDLGNGPTVEFLGNLIGDEGDSVGVVVPWEWPDPLSGTTDGDFGKVVPAIREGEWRESPQCKRSWVGIPVAQALGLDLESKADRTKVRKLIDLWIQRGWLVVTVKKTGQYKDKEFVELPDVAGE